MRSIGVGFTAGSVAFREAMLNVDPTNLATVKEFDNWGRWDSRRFRYDFYWSMYQNNCYRETIHPWATAKNTKDGAYKHIRAIENPAYQLGEFWATRTMGGLLDPKAGDGEVQPTALPIMTDHEDIRPALAQLWKDSDWQTNKELYCRFGAVLGDVGLRIDDDPQSKRVSMRVVHPGNIVWIDRDPADPRRILGYIIQERRYDPRLNIQDRDRYQRDPNLRSSLYVTYTEEAVLDGDKVEYATQLNFEDYAWNGYAARWTLDIPFIPLVMAQHESVGLDWGVNCSHSSEALFIEIDDQASGLSDQIRKAIRAPWLMAGMRDPRKTVDLTTGNSTDEKPVADRDEIDLLYNQSPNARPWSLVFPLDIAGVCQRLTMLHRQAEKNYPELLANPADAAGDGSGRALRTARQVASSKVQSHRPSYDGPLVEAQQMAMAIGGFRKYRGYEGIKLDDYKEGKLAHVIGQRRVFDIDPADEQEEMATFLANANAAKLAGIPLEFFLAENGWSKQRLARLKQSQADAQALGTFVPPVQGTQGIHPPNGTTAVPAPPGVGKSG